MSWLGSHRLEFQAGICVLQVIGIFPSRRLVSEFFA